MSGTPEDRHPTLWKVRERLVDAGRMVRLSIADVELPDGVRFEQYVLRVPRAAMVVVVNDRDEILMLRRHRFIVDRWVWELPGGYAHEGEDPAEAAAREVEEETGWRPGPLEPLLTFQPMIGAADSRNDLFLARGAERTGTPTDVNETAEVGWIPVDTALRLIRRGEILGAATVIGVLSVRSGTHGP